MKEIILSGRKGGIALVDDEDFDKVSEYKWHQNARGYAINMRWIPEERVQRPLWMHRFIMNPRDNREVEHRDHDLLNNQKSNLREVTHAENMRNKKLFSNNKLRVKGVSIKKGRKKNIYVAQIQLNGEGHHIGYFATIEEAKEAYAKESNKYHGEYGSPTGVFKDRIRKKPGPVKKIPRKSNTSGVEGISFYKHIGKWCVRFRVDGKQKTFGYFTSFEKAKKALKEAKKQYETEKK